MSLYRVSINYHYNFKNSPQSYFLRHFQSVCFIVKGNASSLCRCLSILLRVHHQSHVGYPINIQFLAVCLLTYPQKLYQVLQLFVVANHKRLWLWFGKRYPLHSPKGKNPMVWYEGNVVTMEWDHHVPSIFLKMCHSTIDELQDPNEGVHRRAGK